MFEEIHARLEFQDINTAPHDILDALTLMQKQSLATFAKAFAKDGVFEICSGFVQAVKTVIVGVVTIP